MKHLIVLIRERETGRTTERYTDYFLTTNTDAAEENLRAAVREFTLTPEGIQTIKDTSEDFNWGDATMYVPSKIWEKHGFTTVSENEPVSIGSPIEIFVNQDELLIPDEYYELTAE